jgi:hypothetical protein
MRRKSAAWTGGASSGLVEVGSWMSGRKGVAITRSLQSERKTERERESNGSNSD